MKNFDPRKLVVIETATMKLHAFEDKTKVDKVVMNIDESPIDQIKLVIEEFRTMKRSPPNPPLKA